MQVSRERFPECSVGLRFVQSVQALHKHTTLSPCVRSLGMSPEEAFWPRFHGRCDNGSDCCRLIQLGLPVLWIFFFFSCGEFDYSAQSGISAAGSFLVEWTWVRLCILSDVILRHAIGGAKCGMVDSYYEWWVRPTLYLVSVWSTQQQQQKFGEANKNELE